MKTCKNCGVSVYGINKICPLCQVKLDGEDDKQVFPQIDTVYKQHEFFIKLLVLCTISVAIISVAINLMLPQSGFWSFFVVLGVICFWMSITIAFKNRHNLSKNIAHQVITISIMSMLWDYVTGWRGWSLDFVFPITCMVATLSIAILSFILKMKNQSYKVYLITIIILGITPLILYLTNIIAISVPSLICAAVSIIFFVFIVLFYGEDIRKELKKRFHIVHKN